MDGEKTNRISLGYDIFAAILFFGIYTDIGQKLTGLPMISAIPGLLIGMFIFLNRMTSMQLLYALAIAILIGMWSFLAPQNGEFFLSRLLALFQFFYSIILGIVAYWTIVRYNRKQISKRCKFILYVYIAGLALEVYTPFKNLIDTYMQVMFHELASHQNMVAFRDSNIGGGLRRPKLFTSETSYVAMWFSFLLGSKAFLDTKRSEAARNIIAGVFGIFLIRSPISLLGLVFAIIAYVRSLIVRVDLAMRIAISLTALFALSFILLQLQTFVFGDRVTAITSGTDYSTTYRTYGSFIVAYNIAVQFPFTGVGLGSIDLVRDTIIQTYLKLGVPKSAVLVEWRSQIQNLPSALLAYLGFLGTAVITPLVFLYDRFMGGPLRLPFILMFTLLSFTFSSFYTPKFITFVFIFLAINKVYNRDVLTRLIHRAGPSEFAGVA